jgi:multidrug efflux pump subunit AcrA (membrane-fusion protein)
MKVKSVVLIILGLLLLAAVPAGIIYYRGRKEAGSAQHKELYHCPMHPDYVSDKPGVCPICGMTLVKSEAPAAAAVQPGEKKIKFYRSPMEPLITSKTPMKDAMGMDYVPVYETQGEAPEVAGRAAIKLDEAQKRLIGVKTARATYRTLTHMVLSSGKVAYDPALYQSISEYREALNASDKVKGNSWPEVHERAEALVQASALRLRQAGLSEEQIAELRRNGDTGANLLLPGAKAWLYAQVYEYEAGMVKPGQEVEAVVTAYPGRVFSGTIKAVDSILSADTRTLRVRAEVENPDAVLKPEMYAEVRIKVTAGSRLAVPSDAIVNTGVRKLVFVANGEGSIEPREVKTGFDGDDFVEILSGVKAGETVVTSANFLIDSEARIKSSVTE